MRRLHCVKSVQIQSLIWAVFPCIRTRRNSVFGHFPSKVALNSGGLWSRIFFGMVLFLLTLSWKFALCHCLRYLRYFWPLHLHIHPADTPVTLDSRVDKLNFVSMLSIRVCFLGNFQRRYDTTNSSYLVILLLVSTIICVETPPGNIAYLKLQTLVRHRISCRTPHNNVKLV